MNIYLVIFITLVAALVASFSQLAYKKGLTSKLGSMREALMMFRKRQILMGLGGYIVSLLVYLYALANAPLSVVYPTFASTFIFITLLSRHHLKERHGIRRTAGVLLIFVGIAIIALSIG